MTMDEDNKTEGSSQGGQSRRVLADNPGVPSDPFAPDVEGKAGMLPAEQQGDPRAGGAHEEHEHQQADYPHSESA